MRAVVQRVSQARVEVDGTATGEIAQGLLVLACAMTGDTSTDAEFIARKLASLRIFPDTEGKMNRDVRETGGSVLVVSQFTLAADTTSGTRPGFSRAMPPEPAAELVAQVCRLLRAEGLTVETGSFGAKMAVSLVNDGPVTIILDSQAKVRK